MLFNWFSSLYRVFLVLFESLQVWSYIRWEMDQLEQKRQKTMQSGDFHAEQSEWLFLIAELSEWLFLIAEQPGCMFQRQRFLSKLQVNTGFALIIPSFSPSRMWLWYIIFFSFFWHSTLFLEKKPDLRVGDLIFCYFVKGEGHLSRFIEEPPEPYYFISVIFHVALYLCLCVFLLQGWVDSLLSLGC